MNGVRLRPSVHCSRFQANGDGRKAATDPISYISIGGRPLGAITFARKIAETRFVAFSSERIGRKAATNPIPHISIERRPLDAIAFKRYT